MYSIELTPEQRQNLILFLERVDMKGKEVIAYVQILQAIQKAEEKEGD